MKTGEINPVSRFLWIGAVLAFALAAATGAFFRFSLAYGFNTGINLENARHAHSHLMYFAWVTPALFLLIAARIKKMFGRDIPNACMAGIAGSLVLGWLSYVPFVLFGYDSISIGSFATRSKSFCPGETNSP